jgi:hypothetical protein
VRRWWEIGERSLDDEIGWVRDGGFEFEFDRGLFEAREVVVFRGHLRLGDERSPADLVYPPAYHAGEHPIVRAPDLDLGRHRGPDGTLCLTHDVLGEETPMWGAEAIWRAERLWWLSVNDRGALDDEEADAPDPWANYVMHDSESAIALLDFNVSGYTSGYFRARLTSASPVRGVITQLRTVAPTPMTFEPGAPAALLAGELETNGAWMRLEEHPPDPRPQEIVNWLSAAHSAFISKSVEQARADGTARGQDAPALIGFVYPDEGPKRGETHDAWLLVAVGDTDGWSFPRPFQIRRDEAWVRQPQFEVLSNKSVAIIGVGAIGSPVADNLARAGNGSFLIVDRDLFSAGNRVRHVLELQALGRWKSPALAERILRINPWASVRPAIVHLGAATGAPATELQRLHDRVVEDVGACDIIVNASAHGATSRLISMIGVESNTTVVHCYVSAGSWGARVLVQRPSKSGCWDCLALWQMADAGGEHPVHVPPVASDPSPSVNLEQGCADPIFTGSNFDIAEAAAAATRAVVQELVDDPEVLPRCDYDLITLNFRSEDSARTTIEYTWLPPHPECHTCAT